MAWTLRLVDRAEQRRLGEVPQIGDVWFAYYLVDDPAHEKFWNARKSPEYVRDWEGKRPPIYICLPGLKGGTVHWCPDEKSHGSEQGWTVTGDVPNLSISPSINYADVYHGFVTHGMITDDVEGRRFD